MRFIPAIVLCSFFLNALITIFGDYRGKESLFSARKVPATLPVKVSQLAVACKSATSLSLPETPEGNNLDSPSQINSLKKITFLIIPSRSIFALYKPCHFILITTSLWLKTNVLFEREDVREYQSPDAKEELDGKAIFNTSILVLLIAISILAWLNYSSNKKKLSVLKLLEEKNKEIVAQKEDLQATLNMVEKLNSKLDAQSQALNLSALVAILTLDGKIDFINERFSAISGYQLSELAGKNFSALLSASHVELFKSIILKSVNNHEVWRGELCHSNKDNSLFWADTVFVPLVDHDHQIFKIYIVEFDITSRIEAEHKLTEKNKNLRHLNQLKNKMFSIVTHDFRSPLKSLIGTLRLYKQGAITPEEMKHLAGSLLEKVENTSDFLENLLSWSKSQMKGIKVRSEEIAVYEVVNEVIKLLKPQADKKNIIINNETEKDIRVIADLEMIKLILRNLISNAIKFSFEGGTVNIKTITNGKDYSVISIEDFGTGIDEKQLEGLFQLENYSTAGTANELGAGLGLILCKEFIEQNRGEIWVESEKNKGSTFSLSLPLKG